MVDDLSRIERNYGCVPYYNLVKEEEERERYEPSEDELIQQEIDSRVYHEKISILDGRPGKFALGLNGEWNKKRPAESSSWTMSDVYAWQDYGREKLFDVASRLCDHYSVEHDDNMSFYKTAPETFAIGCEYHEHSQIKKWAVSGLDYDQFKSLFRDLHALGCNPSVNYCDKNGRNIILSNSSLGSLRINDFKWQGLETDESLQAEYDKAGFNEQVFREKVGKAVKAEFVSEKTGAGNVDKDFGSDFDDIPMENDNIGSVEDVFVAHSRDFSCELAT